MEERGTLKRYYYFHGHSGMCAWLAPLLVFETGPEGPELEGQQVEMKSKARTNTRIYSSPNQGSDKTPFVIRY
jgi:hypothetical protein